MPIDHPAGACRGRWLPTLALLLALIPAAGKVFAAPPDPFRPPPDVQAVLDSLAGDSLEGAVADRHVSRALAAGLAVALGPFGAHRIYLGTPPKIPVFYSLTFGGFGVLVLIDLGHILCTRDLAPYMDNSRMFMWGRSAPGPVTPP